MPKALHTSLIPVLNTKLPPMARLSDQHSGALASLHRHEAYARSPLRFYYLLSDLFPSSKHSAPQWASPTRLASQLQDFQKGLARLEVSLPRGAR